MLKPFLHYIHCSKGSIYKRSLDVLSMVKEEAPHILTKSGLMVGLVKTKKNLWDT